MIFFVAFFFTFIYYINTISFHTNFLGIRFLLLVLSILIRLVYFRLILKILKYTLASIRFSLFLIHITGTNISSFNITIISQVSISLYQN